MSVIRVHIQKDFVVLSNKVLKDERLSFKAKGLWAYCMSQSEDWHFHVKQLAKVSKDGEDAIYSALKELESVGLVQKIQKNERGKFGSVDYIIYPFPQEIQKILPLRDFPDAGFPYTVNPAITSIDSSTSIEKEQSFNPPSPPKLNPKNVKASKSLMSDLTDEISATKEEFKRAYEKYQSSKGKISNLKNWIKAVILDERARIEQEKEALRQIAEPVPEQEVDISHIIKYVEGDNYGIPAKNRASSESILEEKP